MLNFIRRLFPDWLVSDPSVDELISTFERTKRELLEQSGRYADKSLAQHQVAESARKLAEKLQQESNRALNVADKIAKLID